ncbi:hypothetical protein ACIHCX_28350 [Streptomyces sp. NPDC052043]|uniref:hypothetical protein n=1 Tax=Streptomyces sp. NPDC052043 TaxID=3365684 RepID=UPI0037CE237E
MGDTVGEAARWAAFSCTLVSATLLQYGTSFAGATRTAPGLAAVRHPGGRAPVG